MTRNLSQSNLPSVQSSAKFIVWLSRLSRTLSSYKIVFPFALSMKTSRLLVALALVAAASADIPSVNNCTVHYFDNNIDHFNWAAPMHSQHGETPIYTYKQRYFVYDKYWKPNPDGTAGPIFFYFGNEDNVELYVNHTGLMWESAEAFGALLVFGEHRYYGDSMPIPPNTPGCMNFLTTEQAMADFALLIDYVKSPDSLWNANSSAVVGFGGSYGGMLGAWYRIKYPNSVDGVIAASAPIWSFVGLDPPYNYASFDIGVTYDASAAAGTSDACKTNIKATWPAVAETGTTPAGRKLLGETFRTCSPLRPAGWIYNKTTHKYIAVRRSRRCCCCCC
jgi:lysosomal Pro-X carboxypeptidase